MTDPTANDRLREGEVELLRLALHEQGIGCKPNVIHCRATHNGHANRLASSLRALRSERALAEAAPAPDWVTAATRGYRMGRADASAPNPTTDRLREAAQEVGAAFAFAPFTARQAKAIDALRAALAAAPAPDIEAAALIAPAPDRAALWEKWTGGERLAYGCGFRDGRAEAAPDPDLIAAVEALWYWPDAVSDRDVVYRDDVLALLPSTSPEVE